MEQNSENDFILESIKVLLLLRDRLLPSLPAHSVIKRELKRVHNIESIERLGLNVLVLVSGKRNEQTFSKWEFIIQMALCFETRNNNLCRTLFAASLLIVDRSYCFSGYLYVIQRYIKVCIPQAFTGEDKSWTLKAIKLLEEAHQEYMVRDYSRRKTRDMVELAISDFTLLGTLANLNQIAGNLQKAIEYGEDYIFCMDEILENAPQATKYQIHCFHKDLLHGLVRAYKMSENPKKAVSVMFKILESWEFICETATATLKDNENKLECVLGLANDLLLQGEIEKSITILLENFPYDVSEDGHALANLFKQKSLTEPLLESTWLQKWVDIFEEAADRLDMSIMYKCATCNKPCSTLCSNCLSLPYCSASCQRKNKRAHSKECVKDPSVDLTKCLIDAVDALYLYNFTDNAQSTRRNKSDKDYLHVSGNFSLLVSQSSSKLKLHSCLNKLLQRHFKDFAIALHNLLTDDHDCILTAYVYILQKNWKKTIKFCDRYRQERTKSIAVSMFSSVAMMNLGYYGKACDEINKVSLYMEKEFANYSLGGKALRKACDELVKTICKGSSWFPKSVPRCASCGKKFKTVIEPHVCHVCKGTQYCDSKCESKDYDFHRLLCDLYDSSYCSDKDNRQGSLKGKNSHSRKRIDETNYKSIDSISEMNTENIEKRYGFAPLVAFVTLIVIVFVWSVFGPVVSLAFLIPIVITSAFDV